MARRAKTDTNYVINCAHCLSYEFKLVDVDKTAKVKIYTDTPFKYLPSMQSAAKESRINESRINESRDECIPFKQENITVMRLDGSPKGRNLQKEFASESGTRNQS